MPKEKKPKKTKEPFWKKYSPELKSISEHIGKASDNMKLNDWADLAIMGGLAYLGHKAWGTLGLIAAPIALKLATTPSYGGGIEIKVLGTGVTIPFNSQSVGLTTLGVLGLTLVSPTEPAEGMAPAGTPKIGTDYYFVDGEMVMKEDIVAPLYGETCPEGYKLYRGLHGIFCIRIK